MKKLFLDEIKDFVIEQNISFRTIPVDLNIFPISVLNVLEDEFKDMAEKNDCLLTDSYITSCNICFDEENNIYLQLSSQNKNNNMVIYRNGNRPSKYNGKLIPEQFVIEMANKEEMREYENIKSSGISTRFIKTEDEIESMNSIINRCSKNFCEYISYLDTLYKEMYEKEIIISFNNPKSDCNIREKSEPREKTIERKNEILSFEDRISILESIQHEYSATAISKDKNNLHKVFLYKINNNMSRMILEPASGMNYTKICHIGCDGDISEELFTNLAQKVLELKRSRISSMGFITRHSHTNIDTFKELVYCALGMEHNLHTATVKRIDEASVLELKNPNY